MKVDLSEREALTAYAKAVNTLSVEPLTDLLAEDFRYSSQTVFADLTNKRDFLDYFVPKLEAIRESGRNVFAELAQMPNALVSSVLGSNRRPCLVRAQPNRADLVATAFADVKGDCISGISLCIIPEPQQAARSGEYPQ